MKSQLIVEVAMEIAYENALLEKIATRHAPHIAQSCAMSNSVGGIGPLLQERIKALSLQNANVMGVSLLYENVWVQRVHPWGQIYIEKQRIGEVLRQFLTDTGIALSLEMPEGESLTFKVWKTQLHQADIYLLDAPEIASVVYPGPEDAPQGHPDPGAWVARQKMYQYWLVGRGTLALLKHLDKKPDILVQSETPTFFANHFLVQDAFGSDPFFAETKYVFNDHTPLEYAHPIWGEKEIKSSRLDPKFATDPKFKAISGSGIDVTRLLIGVDRATYGVAKKHHKVMCAMPSLKGLEDKISYITNGVSVEHWQHPDYTNALDLSDADLLALKEKRKSAFFEWVWKRYRFWYSWRQSVQNRCAVLWTRRVTSYKRFDVLERLLLDPEMRRRFLATNLMVLVGGRIHQNDDISQNVMFRLLDLVTSQEEIKDRVVVLDNYNIWDAPKLFWGVDATIMLADDGREASATGFMKAQLNGAAVVGSADGAVPESVQFFSAKEDNSKANGFEVPYVKGEPQPEGLLAAFEALNTVYQNPTSRARLIRNALSVRPQVSVDRTAGEMLKLFATLE